MGADQARTSVKPSTELQPTRSYPHVGWTSNNPVPGAPPPPWLTKGGGLEKAARRRSAWPAGTQGRGGGLYFNRAPANGAQEWAKGRRPYTRNPLPPPKAEIFFQAPKKQFFYFPKIVVL
jgi:hypothetical protein